MKHSLIVARQDMRERGICMSSGGGRAGVKKMRTRGEGGKKHAKVGRGKSSEFALQECEQFQQFGTSSDG